MTNTQPRVCHYCGKEAKTRDHIVPFSLGGPTERWNLVDACVACNSAKSNSLPICICGKCQNALRAYREGEWPRVPARARKARRPRKPGKSKHVHICTHYCERYA